MLRFVSSAFRRLHNANVLRNSKIVTPEVLLSMMSNQALRKRDSRAARNIGSTRFQSNMTEFSELLNRILFFYWKNHT